MGKIIRPVVKNERHDVDEGKVFHQIQKFTLGPVQYLVNSTNIGFRGADKTCMPVAYFRTSVYPYRTPKGERWTPD